MSVLERGRAMSCLTILFVTSLFLQSCHAFAFITFNRPSSSLLKRPITTFSIPLKPAILKRFAASTSAPAASSSEQKTQYSSFVVQKNIILLDKLQTHSNITEAAIQYVNFCDESFDAYLSDRISREPDEEGKQALGLVRGEINRARQRKLIEADKILRSILSAGGLKQMEAKLAYHLRRAEIDMPFMVILQLNIEDALISNVTTAVQVMKHLETLINEHQDTIVSPPVRLMRMLVRTDDPQVRKQMLRQKLILPNLTIPTPSPVADKMNDMGQSEGENIEGLPLPQDTVSPQCEHIVVSAVQSWGGADVKVSDLEATITDVLEQMGTNAEGEAQRNEIEARCALMRRELSEVIAECFAPKVSDMCEDDRGKAKND